MAYAFAGSNPALPTDGKFEIRNSKFERGSDGRRWHKFVSDFDIRASDFPPCGCSSMVEQQPSKLMTRVRFPSPALGKGLRLAASGYQPERRTKFVIIL